MGALRGVREGSNSLAGGGEETLKSVKRLAFLGCSGNLFLSKALNREKTEGEVEALLAAKGMPSILGMKLGEEEAGSALMCIYADGPTTGKMPKNLRVCVGRVHIYYFVQLRDPKEVSVPMLLWTEDFSVASDTKSFKAACRSAIHDAVARVVARIRRNGKSG